MNSLSRYTSYILNLIDIFSAVVAYFLAQLFSFRILPGGLARFMGIPNITIYNRFLLIIVVSYIVTNLLSLQNDENYLERKAEKEFLATVRLSAILMSGILVLFFFLKISMNYSRVFIGVYLVLFTITNFICRQIVKNYILPKYRKSGLSQRLLLVCKEKQAINAIETVLASKDWRYYITAVMLVDGEGTADSIEGIPVLRSGDSLAEEVLDLVLIIESDMKSHEIDSYMEMFQKLGKPVAITNHDPKVSYDYNKPDRVGTFSAMIYYPTAPMRKREAILKRGLDVLFSVLLMPFVIILSVLVLFSCIFGESAGILYGSRRVGYGGRRFRLYRFCTFRKDALQRIERREDPYTVIGKILKKLHLDEFPVLLNILAGEMSFFGPQAPTLLDFIELPKEERSHLIIRPGLTGYWAIEEDRKTILEEEGKYIGHWTLQKDIIIFLGVLLRFKRRISSRNYGNYYLNEELQAMIDAEQKRIPYRYDSSLYTPEQSYLYLFIKRIFDIIVSCIALLLVSPIMFVITILIIVDDGEMPLFGHTRIGKGGRKIRIYKFRSMRPDAADLDKLLTTEQKERYLREFKLEDDPRITKIGEFLRKTSLDELPQLFNILGGSLSVIGPRPIVEEEMINYTPEEQAKFLSVKPGLTGYWQAYARNNATYESGKRQQMEIYYVENQSIFLDIKIFFRTFGSVLRREGAE